MFHWRKISYFAFIYTYIYFIYIYIYMYIYKMSDKTTYQKRYKKEPKNIMKKTNKC